MHIAKVRLLSIAAAAAISVVLVATTGASAKLGSSTDQPCRGTWWIERGKLAYGEKLPEFGFAQCDGSELSTADLEGKPVLLNFWATWCGPCIEELPHLSELAGEAGDSLRIVGVSLDLDQEVVRKFIEKSELKFPVTWDGGGIARDLGIVAVPLTLAIDDDGNLVAAHQGYATKEQFRKLALKAGAKLPDD